MIVNCIGDHIFGDRSQPGYQYVCIISLLPSFPFRWSLDAECNAAIGDPDVNGDTHIYGPTDIDAR